MKSTTLFRVVVGAGLLIGAFLLMGQNRPALLEPGRYAIQPSPTGAGVYVVDTATGAVKFIQHQPANSRQPEDWGRPFNQIQ